MKNAGVVVFTPSEERTDEEIKSVTQINLNSVIYGTTEFARYIKKQIEKWKFSSKSCEYCFNLWGSVTQ